MAWYDNAVFYHIYPLGLTGAPKSNTYGEPEHRLVELLPWIGHIRELGCNALYIGPLFESVGHGYETTDYRRLDSRLGTNDDLARFVSECHSQGVKVVFDGSYELEEHELACVLDSEATPAEQASKLEARVEPLLEAVCINKPYEEMTVEELQGVILSKLAQLGPVTDRMRREVADNIWHESLVTWAKSF